MAWISLAVLVISATIIPGILTQSSPSRVSRIGNPITPSASGVDAPGAIFLLNDVVLSEGVLFAFSAYFRSDKAVRFQIWRPQVANGTEAPGSDKLYLVAELGVIPSVVYAREDVYFESKLTEKCVRVQQGDRVGVFMEETPGAISLVFDGQDPSALSHTLKNLSYPYEIGDSILFDVLTFPYDFSVSAYVDTELGPYENVTGDRVECPKGLLIPSELPGSTLPTTTPVPITGAPGVSGPRGFPGPVGATGPDGATGPMGPAGSPGLEGDDGLHGATGFTGPEGGVGATGSEGTMGATGSEGPQGDKGDQGAAGAVGPAGPPGTVPPGQGQDGGPVVAEVSSLDMFADPLVVLICIIWLAIVTILLIILIVVICCVVRRHKKEQDDDLRHVAVEGGKIGGVVVDPLEPDYLTVKDNYKTGPDTNGDVNDYTYASPSSRERITSTKSAQSENDPEWMSDMKDISVSAYSLDTITRDGKSIRHHDVGHVNAAAEYDNAGPVYDNAVAAPGPDHHDYESVEPPSTTNLTPMDSTSTEALNTASPDNVSIGNISREEIHNY